jgi:hypothetical protein
MSLGLHMNVLFSVCLQFLYAFLILKRDRPTMWNCCCNSIKSLLSVFALMVFSIFMKVYCCVNFRHSLENKLFLKVPFAEHRNIPQNSLLSSVITRFFLKCLLSIYHWMHEKNLRKCALCHISKSTRLWFLGENIVSIKLKTLSTVEPTTEAAWVH